MDGSIAPRENMTTSFKFPLLDIAHCEQPSYNTSSLRGGIMPFVLRPYRRYPAQVSVSYKVGPFQSQGTGVLVFRYPGGAHVRRLRRWTTTRIV